MNPLNYIHKSPHRNILENYLRKYLPDLSGPILDIGSKNRRYDYLLKEKPIAIDLIENKNLNVLKGDINKLDFSDNYFQSIICLEVLEYIEDEKVAFSEMFRVLDDKGSLIISVPFMYGFHEDRKRYTRKYLVDILSGYSSDIQVYNIGNSYTIVLDICRGKIIKIKSKFVKYLAYLPYFALVLPALLFKKYTDNSYVSGYFIIAKK